MATQLGAPTPGQAQQVPDRLNYQGMLRKGDGTPEPAGYKDIEFRIYNTPTAGTLQWARTHRVSLDANGLFNVVLMEGGSPITQGSPLYNDLTSVFTAADGQDRYIELTVAGSTPIQPRQRFVTAAYAFLAADVTQAKENFTVMGSLTVQNSARVQSLTVDTTATLNEATVQSLTVGSSATLNKITPASTLTVDGDMEIGLGNTDYHHLRLGGGNSSGYLYGSYPALPDGIHLGYNYYKDASGVDHVRNLGGPTSRLSLGYGEIKLATGGINTPPTNHMILDQYGRVGIGTTSPAQLLQVGSASVENSQGMIRLGSRSGTESYMRTWDIGVPQTGSDLSGQGYSFVIDDIQLGTTPEFMIKYGSGNVGIGTTSPAAKLDVNGDVKIKSQAPIAIHRYPLPDKTVYVDIPNYYDPPNAYSINEWSAAVIGFTCNGDFSTSSIGQLLNIAMQKNTATGKWRVQFDVRHHSTLNNIVVDVMYIRKELTTDDR